jgi:phytoene/squalene synthetase
MSQFDAELLKYAYAILDQHTMTKIMVRVFLSKANFQFFALVYSYFRWLDDQIDGNEIDYDEKEKLLAQAYTVIQTLKINSPEIPEKCLLEVLNYGKEKNLLIRSPVEQMTLAIEKDMRRVGQIPTTKELQQLGLLRVCSYLNMLKILTGERELMDTPPDYGVACDEIHILRDFEEDYSRGIFNFSEDDIKKYGLYVNNLHDQSWNLWFKDRITNVGILLQTGYIRLLKQKPSRYNGMCLLNLLKYWKCWIDLKARYKV